MGSQTTRLEDDRREAGEGPGGSPGRVVAVLAAAVLAALVAWFLIRSGDDSAPEQAAAAFAPHQADAEEIAALAEQVGRPIYWAGEREGERIELSRTADDRIYVRYLGPGAEVGSEDPYLTIATYPFEHAERALARLARQPETQRIELEGEGIAIRSRESPTSVYLARPGEGVQVEVYAPDPATALRLVRSGDVAPIG